MNLNKTVLVTGAGGYIGGVLSCILADSGYNVIGVDIKRPDEINKTVLDKCWKFMHTSFADEPVIATILAEGVDTIFHLAASSLLGPSATQPLMYFMNNTANTIRLTTRLADCGWMGHIIFSSTAAVYGITDDVVTEESTIAPPNNYGMSKYACEMALWSAETYGIKVTAFRYFNVCGALGDVGQGRDEPHIITRICDHVDNGKDLVIFGDNYPTRDGTCIRDYVHVEDICRAQIHVMEQGGEPGFRAFNLGTKTGTSVGELIDVFMDTNQVHVSPVIGDIREGDPPFLVADPSKFIRETGFEYKHNDLTNMVSSAWQYFKGES